MVDRWTAFAVSALYIACQSLLPGCEAGAGDTSGRGGASAADSGGSGLGGDGCPDEMPTIFGNDPCSVPNLSCDYGLECCCGDCYASIACSCMDDTWNCYFTDACLRECGGAGGQVTM